MSAWRQLGEICQKYLAKGRKVAVVGPVTVRSYTANDGSTRFSLEVTADDVEFLSSRSEDAAGYAPGRSRSARSRSRGRQGIWRKWTTRTFPSDYGGASAPLP